MVSMANVIQVTVDSVGMEVSMAVEGITSVTTATATFMAPHTMRTLHITTTFSVILVLVVVGRIVGLTIMTTTITVATTTVATTMTTTTIIGTIATIPEEVTRKISMVGNVGEGYE